MPWILASLIKFNGEFGPELRAWQERCGKDTWIYFVTIHCKFETGLTSSLKNPRWWLDITLYVEITIPSPSDY